MDSDKILKTINKEINKKHWFGEGTGGSGHMASISLSDVKIISQNKTNLKNQTGLEIIYSYTIIRESEFGGQMYIYEAKIIINETGDIVDNKITSEKTYDLLSGDEINEDFPVF